MLSFVLHAGKEGSDQCGKKCFNKLYSVLNYLQPKQISTFSLKINKYNVNN